VVLADDHGFVRALLRTLLDGQRGLHVVGEAGNGVDAARMVKRLRPNVAVFDISMPGMNGLELTRQTRESSLETGVVIYSFYTDRAYEIEAMRAGASAWVCKTSSLDELVLAIREVAAGRTYFSLESPPAGRPRADRKKAPVSQHAAVHRRN
jgi:DNA-binding NarL/FixJ family response regulator